MDIETYAALINKIKQSQGVWEEGSGEGSVQTISAGCKAEGKFSVAEGWTSKTLKKGSDPLSGQAAHAEGAETNASGFASHTEGGRTTAEGDHAHAEGYETTALGNDSHTEGNHTITNNFAEHAEGKFNISHADSDMPDGNGTVSSIGIGTAEVDPEGRFIGRKNAVEVMQDGTVYVNGIGNYDGKALNSAKSLQEVINNANSGLITVIKDLDLIANTEIVEGEEKVIDFYATVSMSNFPDDFAAFPEKYNLIVKIYGSIIDETSSYTTEYAYTANHFCCVIGKNTAGAADALNYMCYDALDREGSIYHTTALGLTMGDNYELRYEGKMGIDTVLPKEGSKASIYLQKLN